MIAERAEDLGHASLWTSEHILLPTSDSEPFGNLLETFTTLTWLAAVPAGSGSAPRSWSCRNATRYWSPSKPRPCTTCRAGSPRPPHLPPALPRTDRRHHPGADDAGSHLPAGPLPTALTRATRPTTNLTTPCGEIIDVLWTYPQPCPVVAAISGHVAFYPHKVHITATAQVK